MLAAPQHRCDAAPGCRPARASGPGHIRRTPSAPSSGSSTVTPRAFRRGDVGLGRGVLPHADVHRRGDHHRLVGGEQQGGGEVVGDARGHLGEEVGGGRADQHQIGGAATAGCGPSRPRPSNPTARCRPGFRPARRGSSAVTKCAPPAVSTGVTSCPALRARADQLGGLVGRDSAADDEEDAGHRAD